MVAAENGNWWCHWPVGRCAVYGGGEVGPHCSLMPGTFDIRMSRIGLRGSRLCTRVSVIRSGVIYVAAVCVRSPKANGYIGRYLRWLHSPVLACRNGHCMGTVYI